jgi:hypothetical protein
MFDAKEPIRRLFDGKLRRRAEEWRKSRCYRTNIECEIQVVGLTYTSGEDAGDKRQVGGDECSPRVRSIQKLSNVVEWSSGKQYSIHKGRQGERKMMVSQDRKGKGKGRGG